MIIKTLYGLLPQARAFLHYDVVVGGAGVERGHDCCGKGVPVIRARDIVNLHAEAVLNCDITVIDRIKDYIPAKLTGSIVAERLGGAEVVDVHGISVEFQILGEIIGDIGASGFGFGFVLHGVSC